jgi:hypothetical protein
VMLCIMSHEVAWFHLKVSLLFHDDDYDLI